MRYWEDFEAGQVFELGRVTVTGEEIKEFAARWDPQPFHVDEEAAASTSFGGLVASGWHTAAVFMRLYVDGLLLDTSCQGGSGVDELRWLKPVRPGDALTGRATVEEAWPSAKRQDRGSVRLRWELYDDSGEPVLRMRGVNLFGRRPAG